MIFSRKSPAQKHVLTQKELAKKQKQYYKERKRREQKLLRQRIHQTEVLKRMYDRETKRRSRLLDARSFKLRLGNTTRLGLHRLGLYHTSQERAAIKRENNERKKQLASSIKSTKRSIKEHAANIKQSTKHGLRRTKRNLLHSVGAYKTLSEIKAERSKHRIKLYSKSKSLADKRMVEIEEELGQIKPYEPKSFFLKESGKPPRYSTKIIEHIHQANNLIYQGRIAKALKLYHSVLAEYKKLSEYERKDLKPLVHDLYQYLKLNIKN